MSYSEKDGQATMMSREELLTALRTVHDLPKLRLRDGLPNRRTMYEWGNSKGEGTGRFGIDYPTFTGGSAKEIPLALIHELEREGVIVKAYPACPNVNAWILNQIEPQAK